MILWDRVKQQGDSLKNEERSKYNGDSVGEGTRENVNDIKYSVFRNTAV